MVSLILFLEDSTRVHFSFWNKKKIANFLCVSSILAPRSRAKPSNCISFNVVEKKKKLSFLRTSVGFSVSSMPLSHSHCIVGNVSPLWFWLRLLILLLPSYFSLVFFRMWSKFLANHLLPCLPLIHSFFFFLGGYYRDPPRLCRECSLTCTQEAEKLRERAKKVENPSWFWFKLSF